MSIDSMKLSDYWEKIANNKEVYLKIKVSPGAKTTAFLGDRGDGTLKISLQSPADKGKANKELIDFLSQSLNLRKDQITISKGTGQPAKLIKIII